MNTKFKAIDFFCGAGGITCGFQQAGIPVLAGVDIDTSCKDTYEINNRYGNYESLIGLTGGPQFISKDINELPFEELSEITGIRQNDDNLILVGCSPCQFWSQINTTRDKAQKTMNLLSRFQEFVEHFKPGYVVIENVPGLEKRKDESKLDLFLSMLEKNGYVFDGKVMRTEQHEIPQTRKRYVLLATRVKDAITLPEASDYKPVLKDFIGDTKRFPVLPAGYEDSGNLQHITAGLSDLNLRRLQKTPMGGDRLNWADDPELQIPCYQDKPNIFRTIYGRLHWDKIGPTITTKFLRISNGRYGHPEQDRGLSLREGATLQTFPYGYVFYAGSMDAKARQIGNAVPPKLAEKIAQQILK